MDEETEYPEFESSLTSFENGIFSIIITWVQQIVASGKSDDESRKEIADYLRKLANALENTES